MTMGCEEIVSGRMMAVMLALAVAGCGDDGGGVVGESDGTTGGATDETGADGSTGATSAESTTGASTQGTTDGSTGGADDTGTGTTGGAAEPPALSIIFTSEDEGTRRVYKAPVDLSDETLLSPEAEGYDVHVRPELDPSTRYFAYVHGGLVHVADIVEEQWTTLGDVGSVQDIAWSPTESRLARFGDAKEIWVADPDGGNDVLVADMTSDAAEASDFRWVWAPTGDRIAISSAPNGEFDLEISIVDADGTDLEIVSEVWIGAPSKPVWSPTGHRLAWAADELLEPGVELHVGERDGHVTVSDDAGEVGDFGWSPDADELAYVSNTGLHVVGDDGSGHVLLDGNAPNDAYTQFLWSADASAIVWRHEHELHLVDAEGGVVETLADGTGYLRRVLFAPEGQRLAFNHAEVPEVAPYLYTVTMGEDPVKVNHALQPDEGVDSFIWVDGELFYLVRSNGDSLVGVYSTAFGDTRLFEAEPGEENALMKVHDGVLVLKTSIESGVSGRVCSVWLEAPEGPRQLGCSPLAVDRFDHFQISTF